MTSVSTTCILISKWSFTDFVLAVSQGTALLLCSKSLTCKCLSATTRKIFSVQREHARRLNLDKTAVMQIRKQLKGATEATVSTPLHCQAFLNFIIQVLLVLQLLLSMQVAIGPGTVLFLLSIIGYGPCFLFFIPQPQQAIPVSLPGCIRAVQCTGLHLGSDTEANKIAQL